ncbi:m16 family protein, putative, partial [Ichthyophthirius multifiliis]
MDNFKQQKISIQHQQQVNYCDVNQYYQHIQLYDQYILDQIQNNSAFYQIIRPYIKRLIISILILFTSILFFLQIFNVSQQINPLNNPNDLFFQNIWQDITDQIIKPKTIKSKFESIKLKENNLKVLLISEPNLPLSGASLDVNVGSVNNPDQLQGLAHLLEHMLLMGSEKYQDKNLFYDLLSINQGQINSYAENGKSNFYFQSANNNFEQILEVWSRFFIDPLLKKEQLERQINTVNSEYMNHLTIQDERIQSLLINISDKEHPFNNFFCGNFNSLMKNPKNTYSALREFFQKYYFAENMTLVIK